MKLSQYPMGKVLTVGMVAEPDRQEIVTALSGAADIQLVVDGKAYPVRTIAEYQFGAPSYRRKNANIRPSSGNNKNT